MDSKLDVCMVQTTLIDSMESNSVKRANYDAIERKREREKKATDNRCEH